MIGNGNVAIDVARMLVLDLGELTRADVIVGPADVSGLMLADDCSPTVRRNVEILRVYAQRTPEGRSHRIRLRFWRSPVALMGAGDDGAVEALRFVRNELEDGRAVPTGEEEVIPCGLVVRSIGYRCRPLPGLPFDEERGLIRNASGRVIGEDGETLAGEYVAGWIKRGPSGVIGTNKKDAADTTNRILQDVEDGALNEPDDDGDAEVRLRDRVPHLVSWAGWQLIDAHETGRGQTQGRPRVKLVHVPHMLALAAKEERE